MPRAHLANRVGRIATALALAASAGVLLASRLETETGDASEREAPPPPADYFAHFYAPDTAADA
ncbi:MAG TPA: hypothetical protein VGV61_19355, partial [Thermoanaerobaculia bacterium]|nr:hypothetical protein [Thermoanaerobaculia bacterium]